MSEQMRSAGNNSDSLEGGDRLPSDLEELELSPAFLDRLTTRGLTRRRFLTYCAGLTAALALPVTMSPRLAHGLAEAASSPEPHRVLWLEFQDLSLIHI